MKYTITSLFALLLLFSCADEHHQFPSGEYISNMYVNGVKDDLMSDEVLEGFVINDSLVFVKVTYYKEHKYHEVKCYQDTHAYYRTVIKIPTNTKHNTYTYSSNAVRCIRDGLKEINAKTQNRFEVKEKYIELFECEDNNDCDPLESYVQRLFYPEKLNLEINQ